MVKVTTKCPLKDVADRDKEVGARDITYPTRTMTTTSTRLSMEYRISERTTIENSIYDVDLQVNASMWDGFGVNRGHLRNHQRTRVASIAIGAVRRIRPEGHRGAITIETNPIKTAIAIRLRSLNHRRTKIKTRTRGRKRRNPAHFLHG